MNAVDAANKAEIAIMHAVLAKKLGQLYADIWKVGVNLTPPEQPSRHLAHAYDQERPAEFEQWTDPFCCRTVLFFSSLIAPVGYPTLPLKK